MSGCLIDDPPPYDAPQQTPPRLDARGADPLLDAVIVAKTGDRLKFVVPVVSEDAGDKLAGLLLVDSIVNGVEGHVFLTAGEVHASIMEDKTRSVSIPWVVAVPPGCHRLTLRVTHRSNIDFNNYPGVLDKSDLAEVYWWANIDLDAKLSNTLTDCPSGSRATAP